jgi:hypothetical protein
LVENKLTNVFLSFRTTQVRLKIITMYHYAKAVERPFVKEYLNKVASTIA